ncbi:MAG: cytochrome c [Cyclobacteriaceae bacterium]|jgi:cytochrome c551|nr:cytochrome c [Cyclobacteriaceae bacterium]
MKNSQILVFILISILGSMAIACVPGSQDKSANSVKFQQYYVEGEGLYKLHCSNCHQNDGSGLGKLYPPLAKSDFLEKDLAEIVCLIKYGRSGEVWVNGVMYNQPMKGTPALTELEIAEITTYIYNSWGNVHDIVEVTEVAALLPTCNNR